MAEYAGKAPLEQLLGALLEHLKAEVASIVREQVREELRGGMPHGTLFWDTEQAAAFISPRFTADQVRALIASGEIHAVRQNPDRPKSPWLIDPDSVVAWKRRVMHRHDAERHDAIGAAFTQPFPSGN
jgi:hypothetical protein